MSEGLPAFMQNQDAGIKVPDDRITTQPARGFCRNPECAPRRGELFTFPVENDGFDCPKCKASTPPMVGLFTLTHLLLPDPKGAIRGGSGRSYNVACDKSRDYLATHTNDEAVSTDIRMVDCPGCLAIAKKLGIIKSVGWSFEGKPTQESNELTPTD